MSERGLVGRDARSSPRVVAGVAGRGRGRGRRGPRVLGRSAATLARGTGLAASAGVATAATGAADPVDLGGRELERRADLLDLDLEHGALLTLAGLVGARLQP